MRKGRHSTFLLTVHLVFVTKYRRELLDDSALRHLAEHFDSICSGLNCDLEECNGEADHIHLVVSMCPTVSVSSLVNALKGASSRILKKERPDIQDRCKSGALWSESYFSASTGGAPLETIRKYVKNQGKKGGSASSPA